MGRAGGGRADSGEGADGGKIDGARGGGKVDGGRGGDDETGMV